MFNKNFWKEYWIWFFLFVGLVIGAYRLRYFLGSEIPLGYDPGMYKWIFTSYMHILWNFDFSQLPGRVRHEPLLWTIMAMLWKLGANFDWRLTRWIGIINLIPWILIFLLLRKEHKWMGALAAWLYWVSIVGYQVFWWWYFKQVIAVNLLLLILLCLQNKKFIWQWILFFLLVILHKHTALYTWAILFGYTILDRYSSKKIPRKQIWIWLVAGIFGLIVYIPIWNQIMPEAIKAAGTVVASKTDWDFLTRVLYLRFERLILLFSGVWIIWRRTKKKFNMLDIGYLIWVIWLVLGIVNYNRTIVFFDLFVVMMAAYGLWNIYLRNKKFWLFLLGLVALTTGINYLLHVTTNADPLISYEEFSSIKNLAFKTEPNAIIINSHKNYTPWIMGWSQRDYINPGMADLDKRNHDERIKRWENDWAYKCQILENSYKKLNRPIYLWLGEQQMKENITNGNCFSLYQQGNSWQLWKITF